MAFIQIGSKYYNEISIGKVYTTVKMDEETQQEIMLYHAEYLGGQDIDLTEEEYNNLIGE